MTDTPRGADPTRQPLRAVALHNPHLLSDEELARDFVARRAELDRLVGALRKQADGTSQHHLLIGHRGMGKTTLLRRLGAVLRDDEALARRYLPLEFPEEQYNVARLSDVWLNCLDALSDLLERSGRTDDATALDEVIDDLHARAGDDQVLEDRARTELVGRAKAMGVRLVLLLDNIDLVLDRIGEDRQWALRDALEEGTLVVVGASAAAVESTYDYGKAFYDFFRVHRLAPLNRDEVRAVLRALAERQENAHVLDVLEHHPARIDGIRVLAGGNPRTIATLYSVLAAGPDGDLRSDLETLLDRHTPLYKARFEALAPQAQQVLDALCLAWDPATTHQLAEQARLDVTTVSSQLSRLQKEGIVEDVASVDPDTGKPRKRKAFQVAERFFNIWYLMRSSRRVRRKLAWFVSFLELVYGPDAVFDRARRLLTEALQAEGADRVADLALAFGDAIADAQVKQALLHRALDAAELAGQPLLVADEDVAAAEKVRTERRQRVAAARKELRHLFSDLFDRWTGSLLIPWRLKQSFASSPAGRLAAILRPYETLEAYLVNEEYRRIVVPLVRQGADASDPDVMGHVAAACGADHASYFYLQVWAGNLALAGEVHLLTGRPLPALRLPRVDVSDTHAGGHRALRRAAAALTDTVAGRHAAARSALIATLFGGELDERGWYLVNLTIALLCRAGEAGPLASDLDTADLSERHRPLREALRAVVHGENVLNAVAPEVADVSRDLLRAITPPPLVRGA